MQETKRIHGKRLPQIHHQAAMQQLLFKVRPSCHARAPLSIAACGALPDGDVPATTRWHAKFVLDVHQAWEQEHWSNAIQLDSD